MPLVVRSGSASASVFGNIACRGRVGWAKGGVSMFCFVLICQTLERKPLECCLLGLGGAQNSYESFRLFFHCPVTDFVGGGGI